MMTHLGSRKDFKLTAQCPLGAEPGEALGQNRSELEWDTGLTFAGGFRIAQLALPA
jgi:hypothetical protein